VKTKKVICVVVSEGKKHDYKLLLDSKTPIHPNIKSQLDSGYQGFQKEHKNTEIPKKKTKKKPLSKKDKKHNQIIARSRVLVENVIRSMKIFRVLAEKYRNRRKRFTLRLNLIAGIYNYEL
jgi:hypothetical protein